MNAVVTASSKNKDAIEGNGKASKAEVTMWHRRLSHCHEGSIAKIPVIGVKDSSKDSNLRSVCPGEYKMEKVSSEDKPQNHKTLRVISLTC
ncbi:hypothetical protein PR048_005389 [Dryococelus australis]|uniref:GAG-pre-integrase domain-containing protein n=1 Tax=Dryococelus australis TaxID=614101 RepID=A0ABQ9IA84_9NEOP|nr:hypothetical protein PR048_005389 [Dryococelus australis]